MIAYYQTSGADPIVSVRLLEGALRVLHANAVPFLAPLPQIGTSVNQIFAHGWRNTASLTGMRRTLERDVDSPSAGCRLGQSVLKRLQRVTNRSSAPTQKRSPFTIPNSAGPLPHPNSGQCRAHLRYKRVLALRSVVPPGLAQPSRRTPASGSSDSPQEDER